MERPDLNLLAALNILLEEGSVARAAKRLALSPSAMSRTLARLREATGDPLLVRAGRALVPTPRARELRARVGGLVEDAESLLRPAEAVDVATVARTFTFRTSEGFVETFGPRLVERIGREAPRLRLRFVPKLDKDRAPLRDGVVDLETGVVDRTTGPEVLSLALFRDHRVGVVRAGHPLAKGRVTPARYAAGKHIGVSREGADEEPVDHALAELGLEREVAVVLPGGFATATALARATDLIATVPMHHTGRLRAGMFSFALPFATGPFTVSLLWHPRHHADVVHRWLRACVRDVVTDELREAGDERAKRRRRPASR